MKEAASSLPGGNDCDYGHVKLVAALMLMGELMFARDAVGQEAKLTSDRASLVDLDEGFGLEDEPPAGEGIPFVPPVLIFISMCSSPPSVLPNGQSL